jgi:polyvinyl alcohol dehydrogenase (cytochrome)
VRVAIGVATVLSSALALSQTTPPAKSSWPSAGRDLRNTRSQPAERLLAPENVSGLSPRWIFEASGSVSATPAVDEEALYVPDWGGRLYRVDRETGREVWSRTVADITGVAGNLARVTPAIHGGKLVLGDQGGIVRRGARVFAVDKTDGKLLWMTTVDEHPSAIVTQSAVVHGNRVYVGVSSLEELHAGVRRNYPCCTFRGSVLALDAESGAILWRTRTAPDIPGFSGNAVWGSTPVVDLERGTLYVTTGNNYSVPADLSACVAEGRRNEKEDPAAVRRCIDDFGGNYFDAVLALDLETGAVKWARSMVPFDVWTLSCIIGIVNPENCPSPHGPDHDFGQGPLLYEIAGGRELLGVGQKSGIYWALDPDTGEVVWSTRVGPAGVRGGMLWGSASDGRRIYTAIVNSNRASWELVQDGNGTGRHTERSLWSALDPATGMILWQREAPNLGLLEGPVTVANGVLFAGTMDKRRRRPTMFALSASTGEILWSFVSGATVSSGPAVVDGWVYWGSGYPWLKGGSPGNKLYAFRLGDGSPPLPLKETPEIGAVVRPQRDPGPGRGRGFGKEP